MNFVFIFLLAITFRNYLEQFSENTSLTPIILVHYSLFFINLALSLVLLMYFFTRESIGKIIRIVFAGFMILPIVPVIDLLLSGGSGYPMSYLIPGKHQHLLSGFLLLGAPFEGQGITPGQRIEIVSVLLMTGFYGYVKTASVLRSVWLALLTYTVIFSFMSVLFVIKILFSIFGSPVQYSHELMVWFYLLLFLPLSQAVFYFYNKKYFIEIWKDSRPSRTMHFLLMPLLGFVLAMNHALQWPSFHLSWVFILPAVIFGFLFSIIVNNREDYEIDVVSNKDRPTVTKSIPDADYQLLSWACLGLSLIYAMAANFLCFLTMAVWVGNYYLYSSPPFRLKQVPLISKMLIAVNSLLLFGWGYSLLLPKIEIPYPIIFFFLICVSACMNFIDIKDYEGDKKAGIRTLPTILGLERSKRVIGVIFISTYLLTFFLIRDIRLLPWMMAAGAAIYILINKKNYNEKTVFLVYLSSIAALIIFMGWIKFSGQFLDAV